MRPFVLRASAWSTAILLLAAIAPASGCGGGGGGETTAVDLAPAFELQSVDGESVSLADFDGQVVLLDFWATWCPPCREEIPMLVQLQRDYGDRGLQVIGVSDENVDLVRSYVEDHDVAYVNLIDPKGTVAGEYSVPGLPTAYLIDREGKIVKMYFGAKPPGLLESKVRELLGLEPQA